MLASHPVHMLWITGELSRLARLSLASFLVRGFKVALWTYDPRALSGCGAALRDASEIAPRAGDMAALSSLIRYKLLASQGGIWSDMDIVALADAPVLPDGPFVASEKRRPFRHKEASATGHGLTQVTNCFMANPSPRTGDLWHRAHEAVASLPPDDRPWESVGPHLLTRLMLEEPDPGITILPPEAVDPVAWWNVPAYFLEARDPPPSPFMHMYQSIWAKRGVDAEAPFPASSLAGRLWRAYGL
jgi:hypothetical protein